MVPKSLGRTGSRITLEWFSNHSAGVVPESLGKSGSRITRQEWFSNHSAGVVLESLDKSGSQIDEILQLVLNQTYIFSAIKRLMNRLPATSESSNILIYTCWSILIPEFCLNHFFNTIFISSHMYPENPEGTQVTIGSMNMGYDWLWPGSALKVVIWSVVTHEMITSGFGNHFRSILNFAIDPDYM